MSLINFAKKEIHFKIVYYGPGLCGKTTNLQLIHRMIAVDSRGELSSIATSGDRTLFFDFMPLVAEAIRGYTTRFQLYTVPGQPMYNMTRRLVLRGVDGIVFVADSQWSKMQENVESLANLEENLRLQNSSLETLPYVLQFNKRDLPQTAPVHYMNFVLNSRGTHQQPAYEAVASQGVGVFETLNMISRMVVHAFVKAHGKVEDSRADVVAV